MLKPVADEIFAHGVNRILMHESHHQPLLDKAPGLEMGFFGQFFQSQRHLAEQAPAWVSYLPGHPTCCSRASSWPTSLIFYGEDRNLTELYKTDSTPMCRRAMPTTISIRKPC